MRFGGIQISRCAVYTIAIGLSLTANATVISADDFGVMGEFELTVEHVEYSKGYSGPILDSDWYQLTFVLHFRPQDWESNGKHYRRSRSLVLWYTIPMKNGSERFVEDEMYGPRLSMNYLVDDLICDAPIDNLDEPNQTTSSDCEFLLTQSISSLELKKVIEFQDEDGDFAFSPSIDTTVSELKARDVEWHLPEVAALDGTYGEVELPFSEEVQGDRAEVFVGELNEDDEVFSRITGFRVIMETEGPTSLGIVSYFFLDTRVISGINLEPTETKISFHVSDFDFESDTSSLALVLCLNSGNIVDMSSDENKWMSLNSSSDNSEVFFKWSPTAEVEGKSRLVHSYTRTPYWKIQAPRVGSLLTLSYPQGEEVVHDPVLGFEETLLLPSRGDSGETHSITSTSILGLAIGVFAFGIMVALMEHSRKRSKIE